jgi:transposase-like protein
LIYIREIGVMANSILSAKVLQNEASAIAWVEARVWPNGPVCPHCGGFDRIGKMAGKATRIGLYKCYQCRKQFTVKVGTVFEDSHVPMNLWLQAMYLLCSSKKGISSNQLSRTLGVTLKTAWFMSHRIREAMRVVGVTPMGGDSGVVESDETFIGTVDGEGGKQAARSRFRRAKKGRPGRSHKNAVLTLVERGGSARSFHIDGAAITDIMPIVRENVSREATVMTDEAKHYYDVGDEFAGHGTVTHSKDEYVRHEAWIDKADRLHVEPIHTNTVEGYYSIFKRGMKGVYQHCKEKHLHRYLAEFDFRYSNRVRLGVDDVERTARAVKGIVGKRLTYATSHN